MKILRTESCCEIVKKGGFFPSRLQNIISTFSVTLEIQFPVFVEKYVISQQVPGYILQYQTKLWFGFVHPSSDACLTIIV